jgi:N-acetylmuramoyl-L-alanine amidase
MRSIPPTIPVAPVKGKPARRAVYLLPLVALAACVLAGCAGTGGVRNTSHSFTTVVIDAGHGGFDAGTRSSRLILEKDAALDIALKLDARLRAAGLHTVLTRKGDYFVTLDNRVGISNREENAIFVSCHLNESRPRPDIHGAETYYASSASTELGRSILRHVGALPGELPHFMKPARFHVLRLNRNPAVLVECGYLSNRGEAERFAGADYRSQVAGAIADAVIEQKKR